tara:strand:- start:214 stop:720 length:507 start_codon:yes stop_codon:yes gene_type:complete
MELATAGLFQARWTDKIHDEWIDNLLDKRKDLSRPQLERTRALMDSAVLDCKVSDYEYLIPTITLPDSDDRHVVAAAIHAKADAIVTFNIKDFPATELQKYNLEAIHPDDFIQYQFHLDGGAKVLIAAQRCRSRLRNPPKSPEDYIETLRTQSLPKTADELTPFAAII